MRKKRREVYDQTITSEDMISINNGKKPSMKEGKQMKLYKLYRLILALILAAGLSGCATTTIQSRYSYDSRTDFSGLNSYAWVPGYEAAFSTSEDAKHFQSTMAKTFATKGLNLNPDAPDFLIKIFRVESYVEEYKTYAGNIDVAKEMIRINFLNPSSNKVIYESVASAIVDMDANQASKNAIIDKAVEALLSDFPPGI
jgi:hypothetical protein